jgi:hypothetical protein
LALLAAHKQARLDDQRGYALLADHR